MAQKVAKGVETSLFKEGLSSKGRKEEKVRMRVAWWVERLKAEVDSWCGKVMESCRRCGGRHEVPTEWVEAGEGLLSSAGELIVKRMGRGRAVVVADRRTWEVAGSEVFQGLRREGVSVKQHILPAGERPFFPTEELASEVESALYGCDFAVAVGSGTVNDIVKLASHRAGVPYVVFGTAPSMNGYTSSISAAFVKGLKVTTPTRPPVGVILDAKVLASSPSHLRAAGLADLVSKFAANADWLISDLLLGTRYCPTPQEIVESAYQALDDVADGVRKGEPDSCLALGLALILSGFSLTLAGSSAPASGGEHLLSHYLDMVAYHSGGEPFSLHGLQVGVGTLACSRLYELLLSRESLEPKGLWTNPEWEGEERRLNQGHKSLFPFVVGEARKKFETKEERRKALSRWAEKPSEFWAKVRPLLKSREEIRRLLLRAGAPVDAKGLGVPADLLRRAFLLCKDIRARYTVLDLASDLGALTELADGALQGIVWE